jgi:hypothetical protein
MGNGGGGEEGKEGVGDGPGGMHGEWLLEGELCCCGLLEMNFGLPKVQESLLDEVSKFGLFSRWLESLGWLSRMLQFRWDGGKETRTDSREKTRKVVLNKQSQ